MGTGNFPKVLRVILEEVQAFSQVLRTSSSLLDSTLLGPTLWLYRSFSNLWKLFPKVPLGTGNFPKASKSSSRRSEPSLSFLCDPQIVITVLYRYEALPLQISSLLPLKNSLDLRSDLRLSTQNPSHLLVIIYIDSLCNNPYSYNLSQIASRSLGLSSLERSGLISASVPSD